MSKLDSPELKESYVALKMLGYDEEEEKFRCLVDGTRFFVGEDGRYSDDVGNEYIIDKRRDVIRKYQEAQNVDIILGYDRSTGFYHCKIGEGEVYVNKRGDYDAHGENVHIDNWNDILAQREGIEIGDVKVIQTKASDKVTGKVRPNIINAIAGINPPQIVDGNDQGDQNTDPDDEDDREWRKRRQSLGYFDD